MKANGQIMECMAKGKFTWLDGSVYIGDFENSKKHGKGKLIYANGSVDEGTWEYDTFKGK